ncbi:hypothetical protein CPB83DRAFT_865189, partial [Crepidotus variabilis]
MKYSTTSFLLLNSLIVLGASGVLGAPLPNARAISSMTTEFQRRAYIEAIIEDVLDRRSEGKADSKDTSSRSGYNVVTVTPHSTNGGNQERH